MNRRFLNSINIQRDEAFSALSITLDGWGARPGLRRPLSDAESTAAQIFEGAYQAADPLVSGTELPSAIAHAFSFGFWWHRLHGEFPARIEQLTYEVRGSRGQRYHVCDYTVDGTTYRHNGAQWEVVR